MLVAQLAPPPPPPRQQPPYTRPQLPSTMRPSLAPRPGRRSHPTAMHAGCHPPIFLAALPAGLHAPLPGG
jgi:hypothetical protein